MKQREENVITLHPKDYSKYQVVKYVVVQTCEI